MHEEAHLAREQLANDDPHTRVRALAVLTSKGNKTDVHRIIKLLHDGDYRVRVEALHALGALGDREIVTSVIDASRDKEAAVRAAAVRELAALGAHNAIDTLVRLLTGDPSTLVRQSALKALAEMVSSGEPNVPLLHELQAPLITVLHSGRDHVMRSQAASMLESVPSQEVVEALIQALNDQDPNVRAAAALALGAIGNPQAIPALEHLVAVDKGEHWWPNHLDTIPVAVTAQKVIQAIRSRRIMPSDSP